MLMLAIKTSESRQLSLERERENLELLRVLVQYEWSYKNAHVGNRDGELWGFKLLGLRMKRAWVRRIIYHNCIERLSMYRQLGLTTRLSVAEAKSISMSFMCDPLIGIPPGAI